MKIFITGSLGFVGRHLSLSFLQEGCQVTGVGRAAQPAHPIDHRLFQYLAADTKEPGDWQEHVAEHDIVINLTGRSIFTLWSKRVKKEIYDSRVLTTRNLADSLTGASDTIFFSTSAVGYYGDRGEDTLTESEPQGEDFLSYVCADWEREAVRAQSNTVRVITTRFGIVLAHGGGAMASMVPPFKLLLGGRLGSGRQWFPWIHLADLIGAYRFVIEHPELSGPINWCAPHPVRNQELTDAVASRLRRPAVLAVPSPFIKGILGEFGKALICSQRGVPQILLDADYDFQHATIGSALDEILQH